MADDTTRSGAVRNLAKLGKVATTGTRRVVTSKPVRYASEGWTGELVDVGQAYAGQRREIGQSLREGDIKEAGARLGAGYAYEKISDKAVGSGFRKGLPTKTVGGKEVSDVDKFISESGSDPRISRLFENVPEKENIVQKFSRYTGVDLKKPDTRIDTGVLKGTKPLKGDKWNLEGYRVKPDTRIKSVREERLIKQEKQEKQEKEEKQEKIERMERLQKTTKSNLFEPFFVPPGRIPQQRSNFGIGKFGSGYITDAKVKDLSKSNKKSPNIYGLMPIKKDYNKKIKNSFKTNKRLKTGWI